ncbi:MAG: nucleotidyltransferase family protein [Pseudomonadota bacterium]
MRLERAIILAAGLGTRMRPLTNSMPKPLIPVAGKPLIDWCLDWLCDAGIDSVVINTSYLAEQLEAHLVGEPSVRFSREEGGPLETGGGIAKALPLLGDAPFLALNSDAIFPPMPIHPIHTLQQAWRDDVDFLMLLVPIAQAIGWDGARGDFIMDEQGRIRRPRDGEAAPYIFTGVEIIHPRVFAGCPQGAFSLSTLWKRSQEADGWHSRIRAVVHDGPWLNVGDLAGLEKAQAYDGGLSAGKRI